MNLNSAQKIFNIIEYNVFQDYNFLGKMENIFWIILLDNFPINFPDHFWETDFWTLLLGFSGS